MFRIIPRILLTFLCLSLFLSFLPSVFADIRDLYPNYPYHTSPFAHREMYDYFMQPSTGQYSSMTASGYQRPSRHGVRYYRVNLSTGAETEIISSGYNLYAERSGTETGFRIVALSPSIPNTITFGSNEGFGLRFWVAVQDSYGVWHYDLGDLELLYVDGAMQPVERINPCSPTQYILTTRTTIQTPPMTNAYSYWFYPSSRELLQSRLLNIDIDYAVTKEWHDITTWTFNLTARKWFNVANWNFNVSTMQWNTISTWSFTVLTRTWHNIATYIFNLTAMAWHNLTTWTFNIITKTWNVIAEWSFQIWTRTWHNIAQWTWNLVTLTIRTWHDIAEWSFNLVTHGWHTISYWILTVSTTNIPILLIGIIFTASILFLVILIGLKKKR